MSVTDLPKLWTEQEVADHFGVNRQTIARARKRFEIAFLRIGKAIKYRDHHVTAYMEKIECPLPISNPEAASGTSAGPSMDSLTALALAREIAPPQRSRRLASSLNGTSPATSGPQR